MEAIYMSAVRYALGRATYIVGITCRVISEEIADMSEQCKKVMIKDIEESDGYGHDCDKADWMELLKKLKDKK